MRSSRWWDTAAILLLVAALLTAAGRLVATEWVNHLDLVHVVILLGMVAGFGLGQSTFSPLLATTFAVLYGVFAVPWRLILTVGQLSDGALWSDRLVIFAHRLAWAFVEFAQQRPVQDPALFLSAVAALAWGLSVQAGYALTRTASPWRVVLPTGLAVLLIQTTDPHRPRGAWYLAAYAFFSLLLVARLNFLHLHRRWLDDESRIPPLVGLDLSYAILLIVVGLLLFAWTAPSAADVLPAAKRVWDRATRPLEERADNLFASLRRRGPTVAAARYYGDEFGLGQGQELSDGLALAVQVPGEAAATRYYWRARVYDHYADGRWSTAALTRTQEVERGELPFDLPELEGRQSVTFTFTTPDPLVTLYVASQPERVGRPAELEFASNTDGTADIASFHAAPPLDAGQTYTAVSSIADVTISQLREAGNDYPEWILDRYLDLPPTVTPRTRELAELIAEGRETPYDVAAAVTRYLRQNIQYTETLTRTPPADQEPLDWFLFEEKAGFCNYYASSEVLLLRSLGIPARLAVGYGQGELQRGTDTYLVSKRNAHAWPEVYFPGIGWVEFEPTVSEDAINRPRGDVGENETDLSGPGGHDMEEFWLDDLALLEEMEGFGPGQGVATVPETPWYRRRGFLWGLVVLIGTAVGVLVWRTWRRGDRPPIPVLFDRGFRRLGWSSPTFLRRWAQHAQLSDLERNYAQIDRALARLGVASHPAETPAERAMALAGSLPSVSRAAFTLLAEYQAATYSHHHYNLRMAREASGTIRRLSWRAKLRRLVGLAWLGGRST